MEEGGAGPLFDEVSFTIVPSDDLQLGDTQTIIDCISANGGHHVPLNHTDQQIDDLGFITHIISTHIDFPQYLAALEHGIHVIKPSWVTASVQKGKQASCRQYSPDPSQYFRDVVVTSANLPDGDKDAIIAGVMALGGMYSGALSRLVTHIVTNDLDNDKCRIAESKGLKVKIVLPHWFDDCFKLGRMINERPYEFPDPEVLKTEHTTKIRENASPQLGGATEATPSAVPHITPPSSPAEVRKNLNAFMSKKVMLADDLQLNDHLYKTLQGLIDYGGGVITDDVEEADIYIGQYRDGEDYVEASRAGIEVANLSWLYHVININRYVSPLGKLLHYPLPRQAVPGFQHLRISLSNYSGDARVYLENLIKACGAEFTKTMKQDNTHLVTAHRQSEKCEAAEEWNINVINHLWLEESYAKCAMQSLANDRYRTFPARTNLGEITGQTRFDMNALERMYFPKPRVSPQKQLQPSSPSPIAKRSPRKTLPSTLLASALDNQQDTANALPEDADTEDEEEPPQTTKKPRGRPRKSITTTPRFRDDEKENESPLVQSSGRASKAKALGMLHQQADDISLFQKEMKRKGGVTHGGRRSSQTADLSSPAPAAKQRKKRTSDEATYEVSAMDSDLSDGETQAATKPSKKAKRASASNELPPIRFRLMVTGDERWVGNMKKESADKAKLRQLGVLLTQDPKDVDILVAPKILRTRKFVSALACAPLVVDSTYLDTTLKHNKLIEDPDLLEDPENEARYNINLDATLNRARINQGRLLRGWHIYITKDVNGGFDTYKDIIQLNGGSAYLYQGRTGVNIPRRRLRDDPEAGSESQHQGEEDEFDYVYLVSGLSEPETKLWKIFRNLVEKQDLQPRIVTTDWLLNAAMNQEVVWKSSFEVEEATVTSQRAG